MVATPRLRTTTVEFIQSLDLAGKAPLYGSYQKQILLRDVQDVDIIHFNSHFHIISSIPAQSCIKQLIEDLLSIDGIELVKPIFLTPDNYHTITFQIKLVNSINPSEEDSKQELKPEKIEQILDKARQLVSQGCRMLRDITNEKWYFRTELVTNIDNQIVIVL